MFLEAIEKIEWFLCTLWKLSGSKELLEPPLTTRLPSDTIYNQVIRFPQLISFCQKNSKKQIPNPQKAFGKYFLHVFISIRK